MSWTYTGSPFPTSLTPTIQQQRDSVRFLIGDTNPADPQLQDGEVDGLLYTTSAGSSNQGSTAVGNFDVYQAAMAACVALASLYSRKADKTVGDTSIESSKVAAAYRALRSDIQVQAMRHSTPTPYSGGLSLGDMEIDQTDDDLNAPQFTVGQDDNPDVAPDFNTGGGFSQVVPG